MVETDRNKFQVLKDGHNQFSDPSQSYNDHSTGLRPDDETKLLQDS